jgi:hypothetical protein
MSYKDILKDMKLQRESLEIKATNEVLEKVRPQIKKFLDDKLNGVLNEQQLGVVGPGGFPYQGEPIQSQGISALDMKTNIVGLNTPVVSQTNPLLAQSPEVTSMVVGAPPVPSVLDLDTLEMQANAAANVPLSMPVNTSNVPSMPLADNSVEADEGSDEEFDFMSFANDLMGDENSADNSKASATSGDLASSLDTVEKVADNISNSDINSISDEDDLIKIVDPESLVDDGNEEESEEIVSDQSTDVTDALNTIEDLSSNMEDEKDEDEDFITIDQTEESVSKDRKGKNIIAEKNGMAISSAYIHNQLNKVESLYSQLQETEDFFGRFVQLGKIQETLRENQTLREAVKQALNVGVIKSDVFSGIYEVSLTMDRNLRNLHTIYENTVLEIEEDKDSKENSKEEDSDEKLVLEITDIVNNFGNGHVANKSVIEKNEQTGTMKSDDVVYENTESALVESGKMSRLKKLLEANKKMKGNRQEEVFEIDEKQLAEAVKRIQSKTARRLQEEKGAAGAPVAPPEPKTKASLGTSDAFMDHLDTPLPAKSMVQDPEEVEAGDLAASVEMKAGPKAMESLRRENTELKKQLAEAKLINRKLVNAFQIKGLNLSDKQKQVAAKQIKEAKTVREADTILEVFKSTAEGSETQTINEGRVRAGSSSRVVASGSPKQLNEGAKNNAENPYARWQQLAQVKR